MAYSRDAFKETREDRERLERGSLILRTQVLIDDSTA